MGARLTADTRHLDELLHLAVSGRICVPRFQRQLRWTARDVCLFFDSLYKGYPIGTLLFWNRPAEAAVQTFGPVEVNVPVQSDAWWIVDGQQRITSLVAAMLHPCPDPTDQNDPYVVYFDVASERFYSAPGTPNVPETWVPLHRLRDATHYSRWLFEWVGNSQLQEYLETAQRLATRLRNYRVPLYVVEGADESEVRDIFHRVNSAGQRMRAHEVFDALVGPSDQAIAKLDSLADAIGELGFGRLDPDLLNQCALALRGLDVTRRVDKQDLEDYSELQGVLRDLRGSLERAIAFLVDDAGIPHVRLLPYKPIPLITLSLFFHQFPAATINARRLLRRWLWRGMLTGRHEASDRTYLRQCPKNVFGDDESSALRLLADVPKTSTWTMRTAKFDSRYAGDRVALLVLANLRPCDFDGAELPIADLLEDANVAAIGRIVTAGNGHATAANRMFTAGMTPGAVRRALLKAGDDVLSSHAIPAHAVALLVNRDFDAFLIVRRQQLTRVVLEQGARFAEWEHHDRRTLRVDHDH